MEWAPVLFLGAGAFGAAVLLVARLIRSRETPDSRIETPTASDPWRHQSVEFGSLGAPAAGTVSRLVTPFLCGKWVAFKAAARRWTQPR